MDLPAEERFTVEYVTGKSWSGHNWYQGNYRSCVINYNLGKDLIRAFVTRRAFRGAGPSRQWREFAALLSSPRLPSGLK